MYDAVNDPYTYEGSTVLRNLLDLREAEELDAFEAEISTQRASEPYRPATSISRTTARYVITCSKTSTSGPVDRARCGSPKEAIRSAFLSISSARPISCSEGLRLQISFKTWPRKILPRRPRTSWPS